MLPSLRTYRALLVLVVVLGAIGNLCDSIFPSLIPTALRDAAQTVDGATSSARGVTEALVRLPLITVWAISMYGLFTVRRWGPRLSVIATLLLIMSSPLSNYYLNSGWAVVFTQLSLITWGMVVALAYFSPLQAHFRGEER
jgi:hypothetical protein